MSPAQAMERSYATLKQLLREGAFAPGMRLEAIRLADDLGVSMTPVRDVLHRLAGERLVEANSREGFHVPRFTEAGLRDLYEWNSALLVMAARTKRPGAEESPITPLWEVPAGAERIATLFTRIAAAAPNHEISHAIEGVSDRLHPFRIIEQQILERVDGELEQLVVRGSDQPHAIRRYHLRRMRAVPALLRERGEA